MQSSIRIPAVILLSVCLAAAACQTRQSSQRRFELNGKVVSVEQEQRRVTIAHQDIPGFMPAMTMPFAVRDDWALAVLAPGRLVRATLVVEGDRSWIEEITVTEAPGGEAGSDPVEIPGEPEPGTEIPDFLLTNQDGKPIRVHQYRGKALLITFIYTRCPLPDYCVRMSGNFAEIHRALLDDPVLSARTHLLSISIDPEFDTPDVLRSYGEIYIGQGNPVSFSHWDFTRGEDAEVKKAARFFGLSYRRESGQIVHSLRTALIGLDGRLVRLYRGNEWTPGEVLDALKRLMQTQPNVE